MESFESPSAPYPGDLELLKLQPLGSVISTDVVAQDLARLYDMQKRDGKSWKYRIPRFMLDVVHQPCHESSNNNSTFGELGSVVGINHALESSQGFFVGCAWHRRLPRFRSQFECSGFRYMGQGLAFANLACFGSCRDSVRLCRAVSSDCEFWRLTQIRLYSQAAELFV